MLSGRTIIGVRFDFAVVVKTITVLVVLFFLGNLPAKALPSYARQTGQPCGTCHTDFAGLTPYGRLFKIQGYTAGGGPYRTTLFPGSDNYKNSYIPPIMVKSAPGPDSITRGEQKTWVPPISMMAILGFTNTQAPLAPPTAPYNANNNVVLSPVSFFWGGAITDHIGAFQQVTYNAPPAGGFGGDPFAPHTWTWDNTDIRYANSARFGPLSVTYGITANNNPTVQDPWNTTPAWAFPYAVSTLGNGFGPGTILDGAFAAHVVSVGAYAFINDSLYLEASVYRTLDPNTQNNLGTDPFGAPGLFDAAPYWRVAYEPHWGNSWLEIGTFGIYAGIRPWTMPGTITTTTFPQTDNYTDVGFDTQYQYQGDNFWLTARGSYIHENQNLNASFANGLASNPTNTLSDARAYASLAYGNNNRVVLTGQYFSTWGSTDALFAGGSPNTKGWIAEIAYIPFISSPAPGWPWFNLRLGLQYIGYTEFNGTTAGASANNTLFLYAWVAM
ncbi:MAG: cytochrome C [Xanthobacteraceae bacterium]|nr:cytochrome C [Xanthobacteraceae bacterium]